VPIGRFGGGSPKRAQDLRSTSAEAVVVGVMTLAAFLLLTAYYLLKTVREPLILLQGGAETKIYARAAQAVIA
jgi:hypothetical protein